MKLSFYAVLCSVGAQSGCGSIVLVQDQSPVHSPNYPQLYAHDCVLRWVVHAPRGHVVKVGHIFLLSIRSTKHMKLMSNFAFRFSSTLLILTWNSQTRAHMIPSLSWEMLRELRRLVGMITSSHPFLPSVLWVCFKNH